MLDLGANVECDAENLVQFARDGRRLRPHRARADAADRRPAQCRLRGAQGQRRGARRRGAGCAARLLPIRFHGFVEGNDIARRHGRRRRHRRVHRQRRAEDRRGHGQDLRRDPARRRSSSSLWRGSAISSPAARSSKLRERIDPRRYNGAMFLGLNGIVREKPRRHRRVRLRQRDRRRGRHGATAQRAFIEKIARADRAPHRPPKRRREPAARQRRHAMTRAPGRRLRRLSARTDRHQRRTRPHGSTPRTNGSAQRTGIRQRHIAAEGELTSDLARRGRAARARPCRHRRQPTSTSIVLATATPDQTFPATATEGAGAARHDRRRGLRRPGGVPGFIYALAVADNFDPARPGARPRW